MEVIYLSPGDLKPYEQNAKHHPPEQVKHIANSIRKFGFQQPIVVDRDNVVIIGHGRLMAAKELMLDKVPVVCADQLTEEQAQALRLADNKTNESEWDFSLLEQELAALDIAGIDMTDFGFDDLFHGDVFTDNRETESVSVPDDVESVCKRGQLWQLGNHLLLCGDSTSEEDVSRLMGNDKAKLLFTSPPYSDMRDYNGEKDLSVSNLCKFIQTYRPYTDYQAVNLGIQRKDNDIYEYWDEYIRTARECGYKMLAWTVWDKGMTGNIGQAKAFFPLRHEFVFVFGTEFYEINLTWEKKPESITKDPGKKTKRNADGTTSYHSTGDTTRKYKQMESVLFMHPELDNKVRQLHPATFPVGLPAEYIKAMTRDDDIVIEPFGGSGTTLIACQQLNRKCRIMELDEHFCDVIIKRWEDFTRMKAVLL